jgi:uncharacterized protein (TIGR03790 family)
MFLFSLRLVVQARSVRSARIFFISSLWAAVPVALAGGSGLNTVVVANLASSNSCELANYYRLQRQVPPENLFRINWPGGKVEWSQADFNAYLLNPLTAFLTATGLTNQIQYLVLSMDIPYRITGGRANSTTAALFYGFKTGPKNLTNSYARSECRFSEAKPAVSPGYSFLAMMLTAGTLEQAKRLVDQGVISDGQHPGDTAWLAKSSDPVRNLRYPAFDNAVFNARISSSYALNRTNLNSPFGLTNLLGFQTGTDAFNALSNTFVPGAIADSLTSFGGQIFEASGQTNLLAFIHAGAAASYGTITEPQAVVEKFPHPLVYFYQARGFSIAESYYQGLFVPLEGLLVGEPLAAPFRQQCSGGWGLPERAALRGTTNLPLSFHADWPGGSIDAVELFVNGRRFQTLTNIAPHPDNRLGLRLNGHDISYTVPTNASLKSIAAGIAALVNSPIHTNVTRVVARAVGDRIELQSTATPLPPGVFEFVDADASTNAPRTYLAALEQPWISPAVMGMGWTSTAGFRLRLSSTPGTLGVLYASTDLQSWLPLCTNSVGGVFEFVDADAAQYPKRFYRLGVSSQSVPPRLTPLAADAGGSFTLDVTGAPGRPYLVQASSDLQVWSDIFTNDFGGATTVADAGARDFPWRFYRTRSGDANDYSPVFVAGPGPLGGAVVQVSENRAGDCVVWASTNAVDWSPIYRRASGVAVLTEVTSERGTANILTTGLRAAQPDFLKSTACGLRKCSVSGSNLETGVTLIRLVVTRTNGLVTPVAVTNLIANANLKALVQSLADAVNQHPDLTGGDGVAVEDLMDAAWGAVEFNLRARGAGWAAAALQVALDGTTNLSFSLTGSVALDANLEDLRPRNHLYVSAGLSRVAFSPSLDTTQLPDGYNELCAVAYEGTHVNSQTHSRVTVVVSNSPLHAQVELPASSLAVTNVFDVAVTASTNSVDQILLFCTGGFLAGATNQQAANFAVDGQVLGVGQHPFYALVTTTNGFRYRTETGLLTLTRP